MKPPSAQSQAFDAACSVWLGRWIDTIPLGLHRLLSDLRVPDSLLIDGRTKAALFDSLDLNGFWPGLQDWCRIWLLAGQVGVQRCHDLGALADRSGDAALRRRGNQGQRLKAPPTRHKRRWQDRQVQPRSRRHRRDV